MGSDLSRLRILIQENLRVQRGGSETVNYIDPGNVVPDILARQNHVIFARRGCGKTLLLQHSAKQLSSDIKAVYLNCEDFKKHSFPNVLIEILDALFEELERHLPGWFGRRKKSRDIIRSIRSRLTNLREEEDILDAAIKTHAIDENGVNSGIKFGVKADIFDASIDNGTSRNQKAEIERTFNIRTIKLRKLDELLPSLKRQIREFFELSSGVKAVYLQIDDLYHLKRDDQPFVMDYVHRLCKDVPLFFKVATLRHASTLYVDRDGQPIGTQERHDFQPIDIDYTFIDFGKAKKQNMSILHAFGKLSGLATDKVDDIFKGAGFDRLVLAGGGVPRDTLSLFLEVLSVVQSEGDGRIGKDDVRILSKRNFERRIEELKHDSEVSEQEPLIKGIYVIREFCLDKKTNIFLVSERVLQQNDFFRSLIYRLLDYRIIHSAATALTHKSHEGTFQAFAIDIGCYAHLRKLEGRFKEIDLSSSDAKEKIRSAPLLDLDAFGKKYSSAPQNAEENLTRDEDIFS